MHINIFGESIMLYYSIVPYEITFASEDESIAYYTTVVHCGVTMEVSGCGGEYRVERLYSTNPGDYLHPDMQVGRII